MKISHSIVSLFLLSCTGCSSVGKVLNPFQETPPPEAYLGERNDKALAGDSQKVDTAQQALKAMASYRHTQMPEPAYPVMQPSVVRLMWIPDHLNKNGDLVPAHYYYLKVLQDRWAVQDAFELESQLGSPTDSSNLPYVYPEDVR